VAALIRVARRGRQVALTNIAKHAGCGYVDILLERRSNQISLIIEDDGAGFDAEDNSYDSSQFANWECR
jgi:signal transduction histidine kinase